MQSYLRRFTKGTPYLDFIPFLVIPTRLAERKYRASQIDNNNHNINNKYTGRECVRNFLEYTARLALALQILPVEVNLSLNRDFSLISSS